MSITQHRIARHPARQRRAAHHEGGRRRGPRPRGHVALLAPPRVRPTQLPYRSKRPLLARRSPPLARTAEQRSSGSPLRPASASRWKAGWSMASIEKRPRQDGRASWRAHYRTPSGEQRNKTFDRKADAERFLANVESSKNTGSFVDSVLARITVGDWATHWLDNQTHLKPSTHERYAGIIREHIRPKWDRVKLANVSHADVQKWVTALSKTRSPATVRKVHRVLSLILNMAVKDGRLARNVEVSDRQGGVWPSQRGLRNPRLALSRRPEGNAPGRNRRRSADTRACWRPTNYEGHRGLADRLNSSMTRGEALRAFCRSATFAEVVADCRPAYRNRIRWSGPEFPSAMSAEHYAPAIRVSARRVQPTAKRSSASDGKGSRGVK
jgi:hypothetical protein